VKPGGRLQERIGNGRGTLVDTVGDPAKLPNDRPYENGIKKSVYIRRRQLLLAGIENDTGENVQN